MPPFVIGYIDKLILVQHHPDMNPDNSLHFPQRGLVACLDRFQIRHELIGDPEADRLQDLRFGLYMVVQTGRFHADMFREVPHAGSPKTFLPEELRRLLDDHLLFGAVLFALNFSHTSMETTASGSRGLLTSVSAQDTHILCRLQPKSVTRIHVLL